MNTYLTKRLLTPFFCPATTFHFSLAWKRGVLLPQPLSKIPLGYIPKSGGGDFESGGAETIPKNREHQESFRSVQFIDQGNAVFAYFAAFIESRDQKRAREWRGNCFAVPEHSLSGGITKHAAAFDVNRCSGRA